VIDIRDQNAEQDLPGIRKVNRAAFASSAGTNIFHDLCQSSVDVLSLVAVDGYQLVGHVIFSPVTIDRPRRVIRGMGLGELAVLPEYQQHGVGTRLVNEGLETLRGRSCPFIIVIGHASYYPRFGFVPGADVDLQCQWEGVSEDKFMVLVLDQTAMAGVSGVARYVGIP
jgi:putative acetyltransferase